MAIKDRKHPLARLIYIATLVAIVILGVAYLYRPGPPHGDVESRIVAVGDSWVEGVGATEGNDFVSVLSRRLGIPIVNEGHTGDTTADILARIGRDVLTHDPTHVIVLVGGNDVIRLVPRKVMRENLDSIVRRITETGADVLLLGYRCGIAMEDCAGIYEDVAEQYGAVLVPAIQEDIIGRPSRMSDPIHPNNAGYAHIADRVEGPLRAMLGME